MRELLQSCRISARDGLQSAEQIVCKHGLCATDIRSPRNYPSAFSSQENKLYCTDIRSKVNG